MYLIDDVDLVNAHLRGNPNLVDQTPDIIHRIVGSAVEFIDVEGSIFIKRDAGGTGIACFGLGR